MSNETYLLIYLATILPCFLFYAFAHWNNGGDLTRSTLCSMFGAACLPGVNILVVILGIVDLVADQIDFDKVVVEGRNKKSRKCENE